MADSFDESTFTTPAARLRRSRSASWCVAVVWSPDAALQGRELPLDKGLSIGRSARGGVDQVIADRQLSRRHLTIERKKNVVEVVDHESKNGTWVDGIRLTSEPTRVQRGALIRAGETLLQLDHRALLPGGGATDETLLGWAPGHLKALHAARTVARNEMSVVLHGETGTGKELFARLIHQASGRRGPFVAVNCSAIPVELAESSFFGHRRGAFTGAADDREGYIGRAARGTLFLDEIGDLPAALQPKLLRVLETKQYERLGDSGPRKMDARIVAATNFDLAGRVEDGAFRRDLYSRLAGFVVDLPPLRERRRDIPLLFAHFVAEAAHGWTPRLEPELVEALALAPWPMNVRELRTLAGRVAMLHGGAERLDLEHLPELEQQARQRGGSPTPTRAQLAALLEQHGGNLNAVARHLDKHRQQVYRWLDRYELDPDDYR